MTNSEAVPEFPDVDITPEVHQARLASRNYWERNKERLQGKQKEYKRQMRQEKAWIVKYDNAYQLARRGEYLPTGGISKDEKRAIRDLYQAAHEAGGKVVLVTPRSQGGKFTISNLQVGA